MKKLQSQRGFVLGLVIAVVAIVGLLGGAAYVANKNKAEVNTDKSTTTGTGIFNSNASATGTLKASTTGIGTLNNPNVNASGSVNVNVDLGLPPGIASKNIVTYTDNGFQPATLTIEAGESVTFVNKSSYKMNAASDDHPTHQLLPGFDAKTGLGLNETFTFTFTKTGSWGYHNHLRASDTGTVIVQ